MDRLHIHDLSKSREEIALERSLRFAALDGTEKFRQWLTLMNVARKINGGKPLKAPQGKGYVFKKPA
jgi:hypothetical protein